MESIPSIGFGTWKIAKDVASDVVYNVIKMFGIRHLDCACDYGNEVEVGDGIRRAIKEGIVERKDLWITSKLWNTYHSPSHVEEACKRSLTDLGIEWFDLYLVHFPISLKFVPFETRYPPEWIRDPSAPNPKIELSFVPMHQTWAAMETLVGTGLTKRIGVSNFNYQLLTDLLGYATIRPYANQIELHPYLTQELMLEFCAAQGIHVTAFSPLGSPSYVSLGADKSLGQGVLEEAAVKAIAEKHGKSVAQVVLKWNLQRGVSIVPKSSNPERIKENMDILDFELSADEMATISALNRNIRFNDPGVFGRFMGQPMPIFN